MTIRWSLIGVALALLVVLCSSCTNTPSPVGSSLLPPGERVVLHTLDSRNPADSVQLAVRRSLIRFGTGGAANVLLGTTTGFEARALYKFALAVDTTFIPDVLNTWTLHDCYLSIPLTAYRFGDTSSSVHLRFEVREVITPFESGATWDSLGTSSSYSSTVLATVDTTVLTADSTLRVPLDTGFVMRLVRYQWYDSLYVNFAGLVVLPLSGTSGIVGLYPSTARIAGAITRDTSTRDTTLLRSVTQLYISNVQDLIPSDRIETQMGGAILSYLTLSTPLLPRLSAINAVAIDLTLDSASCAFGKDFKRDTLGYTSRDSVIMVLATGDSALGTTLAYGVRQPGTQMYHFPLVRDFVDLWRRGTANYGVTVIQSRTGSTNPMSTADRFVFYGTTAADTLVRPRVVVTYSTVGN